MHVKCVWWPNVNWNVDNDKLYRNAINIRHTHFKTKGLIKIDNNVKKEVLGKFPKICRYIFK